MSLISIIIPTTRLENKTLQSFFRFKIPERYGIEYLFIIDDPSKKIDNFIKLVKKYPQFKVKIIRNAKNLGISETRNIGIENACGDFILFLDDDCIPKPNLLQKYIKAFEKNPNYPGFIGLTSAPKPVNSFDKAVCLSDMRHFFEIANYKKEFYWGITANLFLKREAIGEIRFSKDHPKKGGSEDIAFCLDILKNYNKNSNVNIKFKCVPEAEVEHPFWKENFNGYKRFLRWGYGDVILHKKFPKYKYHQYPNLIEFLFLVLIINIFLFNLTFPLALNLIPSLLIHIALILVIGVSFLIWELICEAIKLNKRGMKFTLIPLIKAVIIRQLNDMGRFLHQFPRIWRITSRWDYFCTGESLKYETKTAAMKFFGFITIYLIILFISINLLSKLI
ncbi:MAG: glycosyltransferase [Candidatus Helarchaeota archaeon]